MCGIAGFIETKTSKEKALETIGKMLKSIIHRGPDNSATWQHENITLGHNRLSIIDLSEEANQPFEYDDVVIVFNGEIYNYIEVRAELQKLGWKFKTQGDTEVICAAYKQWGENCVSHFVGMWAFALWDKKSNLLFCSRDRFGIKPFYFFQTSTGLYFASEYKAFKALENFDRTINEAQLKRSIALNFVTYKSETFYSKLQSLQPAHNLILRGDNLSVYRYWDVPLQSQSVLSKDDKFAHFKTLFFDSIKLHSRSDVSNGICLSGGLDSSAIASAYSTVFPDSSIQSFSIYYEGYGKVDERPFVNAVIDKYSNIVPHYFSPQDDDIANSFHDAAYSADVPLLGSSYISQYFLMKLAAKSGVKVVLDGQGSDEYLGGYLHSFYRVLGEQLKSLRILAFKSQLDSLAQREHFSFGKKIDFALKSIASSLLGEHTMYALEGRKNKSLVDRFVFDIEEKSTDKLDNFLYHILMNTTLQTLLHHEDRNSMAFSIESRVPFLDHRLVEFAFTLSTEDRISPKAETKFILREGLKDILPKAVYERKDKKGFVTPGEVEWLNGPLKFLLHDNFDALDFMNKKEAMKLIDEYKAGDVKNASMVWKLAATNYWLKKLA